MKRVIDILKELGGVSKVADKLGVPYQTVHSWRSRGFPHRRARDLVQIAKSVDVDLSYEDVFTAVPLQNGEHAA